MAGTDGPGGLPGRMVGGVTGSCDTCRGKLCDELSQMRTPEEVAAREVWFKIPRLKALMEEREAALPVAVNRIQGETDSFGSEMHDLCGPCTDEFYEGQREYRETPRECDWCKKVLPLSPVRDYDEGSHGPVYEVCDPCAKKQQVALEAEMDDYYYDYDDYDM